MSFNKDYRDLRILKETVRKEPQSRTTISTYVLEKVTPRALQRSVSKHRKLFPPLLTLVLTTWTGNRVYQQKNVLEF